MVAPPASRPCLLRPRRRIGLTRSGASRWTTARAPTTPRPSASDPHRAPHRPRSRCDPDSPSRLAQSQSRPRSRLPISPRLTEHGSAPPPWDLPAPGNTAPPGRRCRRPTFCRDGKRLDGTAVRGGSRVLTLPRPRGAPERNPGGDCPTSSAPRVRPAAASGCRSGYLEHHWLGVVTLEHPWLGLVILEHPWHMSCLCFFWLGLA